MWRFFTRYVYTIAVILAVAGVLLFSTVATNLLIVRDSHLPLVVFATGYIALLVYSMTSHGEPWVHRMGIYLATVVFTARAAGFIELLLFRGEWHLLGACIERVLLLFSVAGWHITMGREAAAERDVMHRAEMSKELRAMAAELVGVGTEPSG